MLARTRVHATDLKGNDCSAHPKGRNEMGSAVIKINPWTKTPPTAQGEYWHWNGDPDSAPLPMFVLYSGTSGKCFVSMGQLGLAHAIDCDEYGGWWSPLPPPPKHPDFPNAWRVK